MLRTGSIQLKSELIDVIPNLLFPILRRLVGMNVLFIRSSSVDAVRFYSLDACGM